MRYVLTDDTRLARPELLEEVEGVCRRRRWDKRKHKHARSDNVTVAVAVRPVAVVVRHLVRGNAVAHVVLVPWCDKKPRKGRPRGCVLTDVTRLARPWRKGDRVGHQNDSLPSVQPVHAREGQSRAIPNVLKSTSRIRMISSLCSAPHDKKDNNVERSPSETVFMVHSSQTATSTEVETFGSCRLPALVFNHFDVQSRRCRLSALVLNYFDIQSTARESHCVNTVFETIVKNKKKLGICEGASIAKKKKT